MRKLIFFCLLLFLNSSSYALQSPAYAGGEHIAAGNDVQLFINDQGPGRTGYLFSLPNGLQLSYGDLVAMGDFYGTPDKPISGGKSAEERILRFVTAVNSFSTSPKSVAETRKILAVLHEEGRVLEDAIKHGEDPEKIYKSITMKNNQQLNCITGGGCGKTWYLKPGRYLKLARKDYDHFGNDALLAYQVGHDIALKLASSARETKDLHRLKMAYVVNAFASHYLSDRFAAGHIRTPRTILPQVVTPSVSGDFLAGFMHIEENAYGLHVHNNANERWFAYGDHAYFSGKNRYSRLKLYEALQLSADEIYAEYQGNKLSNRRVMDIVPQADEYAPNSQADISPLFYWDGQKLFRRKDTANVYSKHWTTGWWAWSTLLKLSKQYGIPPEVQANLAASNLGKKAYLEGLIDSKEVIQYYGLDR